MLDENISNIGQRIRSERTRLGINQIELAAKVQVSRGTQIAYESDARLPDAGYLLRIGKLGLDVDYILFGTPQQIRHDMGFNWDLYHRVVDVIEEWTVDLNIEVPLKRRQELAKIIFDACSKRGRFDPEIAELVLRTAA